MTKYNDKARDYTLKYQKEKLKRIPLNVQLDEYQLIKAAADRAGIGVNTWIKNVIREKLKAGEK